MFHEEVRDPRRSLSSLRKQKDYIFPTLSIPSTNPLLTINPFQPNLFSHPPPNPKFFKIPIKIHNFPQKSSFFKIHQFSILKSLNFQIEKKVNLDIKNKDYLEGKIRAEKEIWKDDGIWRNWWLVKKGFLEEEIWNLEIIWNDSYFLSFEEF